MALDRLGSSLYDALKKVFRASVVDEATVKELVRDIQRALLQADVNVQLVLGISKRIEERALNEKVPPVISRRKHFIKVYLRVCDSVLLEPMMHEEPSEL